MEEDFQEKKKDLAYVPTAYVSSTDATRKYKLTENELVGLDALAVVGTRYGQEGIFYPPEELQ